MSDLECSKQIVDNVMDALDVFTPEQSSRLVAYLVVNPEPIKRYLAFDKSLEEHIAESVRFCPTSIMPMAGARIVCFVDDGACLSIMTKTGVCEGTLFSVLLPSESMDTISDDDKLTRIWEQMRSEKRCVSTRLFQDIVWTIAHIMNSWEPPVRISVSYHMTVASRLDGVVRAKGGSA
jgi:hypothetical protein